MCLSDREASIMRRPWPTRGCRAMEGGGGRMSEYVRDIDASPGISTPLVEMLKEFRKERRN